VSSATAAQLAGGSTGVINNAGRNGYIRRKEKVPGAPNCGYLFNVADVHRWVATRNLKRPWSEADDAALQELASTCTWDQVGAYLGRSGHTCCERARRLRQRGERVTQKRKGSGSYSPFAVPITAILIAKTCPDCGYFKSAKQFCHNNNRGRSYDNLCRGCRAGTWTAREVRRRQRDNLDLLNDVTAQSAHRHNKQYTQDEDRVLADESLSVFEAALRLGRTFNGVRARRQILGVVSRPGRPKIVDGSYWLIDFPAAMTALADHFKSLGQAVPEHLWEWTEEVAA
jgi:hypothetical protein